MGTPGTGQSSQYPNGEPAPAPNLSRTGIGTGNLLRVVELRLPDRNGPMALGRISPGCAACRQGRPGGSGGECDQG